jgi:murein DD-endopeptidase MepM/ murein hydrolase activator NlpD
MVGQQLRIARVSGVPHVVSAGETVVEIAAQLRVPAEAILSFGPNHLQDGRALVAGSEIFVPGADRAPTAALAARGAAAALAIWSPEAAGVVLVDATNMREGPGTDYRSLLQLDRGRQVALRARHGDWLQVELAGMAGWVRTDLLRIADGLANTLPATEDFPPPPPRWVWPARGTITSTFGPRWGAFHNGLDIANRAWTPIVAARTGWVREAGWCRGYGYCVKIAHSGGIETIYGHMVATPIVRAGDEVAVGELIGYMGSTFDRAGGGYSTGVHLHFTLLVHGRAVNPLPFLP